MTDLRAPVFTSREMTLHDLLLHVVSRRVTATLRILPTGIKLHVLEGALLAVEGGEPLGQLLLSRGSVTEDILAAALKVPGPLGQALLVRQQVSREALSAALTQQARLGLTMAMYTPYDTCELLDLTALPAPFAEISASTMLLDALADEQLPTEISFHLAASTEAVTLSADDWHLLRQMNGRRPLRSAMVRSGLTPDQAQRVAAGLLRRQLLEPAPVMGLKLIVAVRQRLTEANNPPSSIQGNLFLNALDGLDSVWTVAERLRLTPEGAAQLLASLHRDQLISVVRGAPELRSLLEEY